MALKSRLNGVFERQAAPEWRLNSHLERQVAPKRSLSSHLERQVAPKWRLSSHLERQVAPKQRNIGICVVFEAFWSQNQKRIQSVQSALTLKAELLYRYSAYRAP